MPACRVVCLKHCLADDFTEGTVRTILAMSGLTESRDGLFARGRERRERRKKRKEKRRRERIKKRKKRKKRKKKKELSKMAHQSGTRL